MSAGHYGEYCQVLDSINARCIRTNLDKDFRIQDEGTLLAPIPASRLYEAFTSNYEYAAENTFDGLLAYLSGSMKKEEVGGLFEGLERMLDNVAIDTPEYSRLQGRLMDNMIDIESSLLSVLPEIEGVGACAGRDSFLSSSYPSVQQPKEFLF